MIDLDKLEELAKDARYVPNVPDACLINTDFARRAAFRKVCQPNVALALIAEVRALRTLEEAIRHDRAMFEGTSDEDNPMGVLVTRALEAIDAARNGSA